MAKTGENFRTNLIRNLDDCFYVKEYSMVKLENGAYLNNPLTVESYRRLSDEQVKNMYFTIDNEGWFLLYRISETKDNFELVRVENPKDYKNLTSYSMGIAQQLARYFD